MTLTSPTAVEMLCSSEDDLVVTHDELRSLSSPLLVGFARRRLTAHAETTRFYGRHSTSYVFCYSRGLKLGSIFLMWCLYILPIRWKAKTASFFSQFFPVRSLRPRKNASFFQFSHLFSPKKAEGEKGIIYTSLYLKLLDVCSIYANHTKYLTLRIFGNFKKE